MLVTIVHFMSMVAMWETNSGQVTIGNIKLLYSYYFTLHFLCLSVCTFCIIIVPVQFCGFVNLYILYFYNFSCTLTSLFVHCGPRDQLKLESASSNCNSDLSQLVYNMQPSACNRIALCVLEILRVACSVKQLHANRIVG